jgi:DNA-binding CsgD family transcriptional regulator
MIKAMKRKKPLTPEEKEQLRLNWLAPAGSTKERQYIKRLATTAGLLSEKERAFFKEWLVEGDTPEGRNQLFWKAAKKSVLGSVVHDTALRRHKAAELTPDEFRVACFVTRGCKDAEIADILAKSVPWVEKAKARIKEKITLQRVREHDEEKEEEESQTDVRTDAATGVTPVGIARWFLGL